MGFSSRYSRQKSLPLLSDFASSKNCSQIIIVEILLILYPPGPLPITPAAPTVSFWTRTGLCTQWLRRAVCGTKPGHLRSWIPARQFVHMHILSQIYSTPSLKKIQINDDLTISRRQRATNYQPLRSILASLTYPPMLLTRYCNVLCTIILYTVQCTYMYVMKCTV